jgi:Uma2 family endonuclease
MSTTIQRTTANDLLRMPDDGFRYELVRGELRKMSPAGHKQGRIAMKVATPLDTHVTANDLGAVYAAETGFLLSSDPDTVRAPDISFVSRERLDDVGDVEGYWPGAPDLVVEVMSPGDTYGEVEGKVLEWLDAGARMVVVVNARKHSVSAYRSLTDIVVLTENDTLDGADIVPGWRMSVKDIFR